MTPLKIKAKQFQMRLYALKLSAPDRLAVTDKWPRTLLACLALRTTQMERELTKAERKDMAKLERLVELRLKLDDAAA